MESSQRKKVARNITTAMQVEPSGALVAISPVDEELNMASPTAGAAACGDSVECRRSSRKKIPKFDVRDLLLKQHRKPHKIQIEARIDSNAPSTSKATNNGNASALPVRNSDKCFIEKTSIIQRSPAIAQVPIPVTTEIFKPSQTSSLIVAQMESSTPSPKQQKAQRQPPPVVTASKAEATADTEMNAPKRRGRPPKNRSLSERLTTQHSTEDVEHVEDTTLKRDEADIAAEIEVTANLEKNKNIETISQAAGIEDEITTHQVLAENVEKKPTITTSLTEARNPLPTKSGCADNTESLKTESVIAVKDVTETFYASEAAIKNTGMERTQVIDSKPLAAQSAMAVDAEVVAAYKPAVDGQTSPTSKDLTAFKSMSSPPRKTLTPTPRRCERRSGRRLDDSSSSKTLEETFAEIAAKSSKAILEMATQKSTEESTELVTESFELMEKPSLENLTKSALDNYYVAEAAGSQISAKKRGRKSKSKNLHSDDSFNEETFLKQTETELFSVDTTIEEQANTSQLPEQTVLAETKIQISSKVEIQNDAAADLVLPKEEPAKDQAQAKEVQNFPSLASASEKKANVAKAVNVAEANCASGQAIDVLEPPDVKSKSSSQTFRFEGKSPKEQSNHEKSKAIDAAFNDESITYSKQSEAVKEEKRTESPSKPVDLKAAEKLPGKVLPEVFGMHIVVDNQQINSNSGLIKAEVEPQQVVEKVKLESSPKPDEKDISKTKESKDQAAVQMESIVVEANEGINKLQQKSSERDDVSRVEDKTVVDMKATGAEKSQKTSGVIAEEATAADKPIKQFTDKSEQVEAEPIKKEHPTSSKKAVSGKEHGAKESTKKQAKDGREKLDSSKHKHKSIRDHAGSSKKHQTKLEQGNNEGAEVLKKVKKDKSADKSESNKNKKEKEKLKLESSQTKLPPKQGNESIEPSTTEKKKRKDDSFAVSLEALDKMATQSPTTSKSAAATLTTYKSIVKTKKEKSNKDITETPPAKKTPTFDQEKQKHKSKHNLVDAPPAAASTPMTSKKEQQTPATLEVSKNKTHNSSDKKLKKCKQSQGTPGSKTEGSSKEKQKPSLAFTSGSKEKKKKSKDKEKEEKHARKERQRKLEAELLAALAPKIETAQQKPLEGTPQLVMEATQAAEHATLIDLQLPPTPGSVECSSNNMDTSTELTSKSDTTPDPFYDIAKFIEDGVNLLKRDYKLTENEEEIVEQCADETKDLVADNVERATTTSSPNLDTKVLDLYETPVDTPVSTPARTTPSSSPVPTTDNTDNSLDTYYYSDGKRRSHRLKKIINAPKALEGRGLAKLHYSLEDHLTDLAEVEAKNARFLKDMEERLSNFQVIKESEYHCERLISREARKMICDCFLTPEEAERGELGCGEDCLNRLLMIECGANCKVGDRCTNKRFQKILCAPCRVFRTEKKGFGIMADVEIHPNEFIMEYVGEVLDSDEFEQRRIAYSKDKNRHYYFMELRRDAIIDATTKGNISRFINHSCDPNAETQKWTVNGELRVGFFSRKTIMPGEEITFDYQYQRYGREAQRCYCESANCRGWIGEEPDSDEGEQIDDEDEEDEEEDEEEEEDVAEEVTSLVEGLLVAGGAAEPIGREQEATNKAEKAAVVTPAALKATEQQGDTAESKQKFMDILGKITAKLDVTKQAKLEKKKIRKKRKQQVAAKKRAQGAARFLEDPDLEDEIDFLSRCGLKNQSDTLRFSRLMVRAKLVPTRLNLLAILREGELPCRRLFLDYHGLHLLHGWMNEDGRTDMTMRLALVQTLECLPIVNKTVLTESKVYQSLRGWCGAAAAAVKTPSTENSASSSSPSDESSKESGEQKSQKEQENVTTKSEEIEKCAANVLSNWDKLPEIFRIPKRERIEQMKEHEREADRQYAATIEAHEEPSQKSVSSTDRYQRDRFERRFGKQYGIRTVSGAFGGGAGSSSAASSGSHNNPYKKSNKILSSEDTKNMSKEQRRELFAAKVAHEEAEKRMAERRREFETKCNFFGLDPRITRPEDVPFCVSDSGQWFNERRQPIAKPPSFAHVQTPIKPKSTNSADYFLPKEATNLPPEWAFAITDQGKIYYYHLKHRVPQWEPPTPEQISQTKWSDTESESDYDEEEVGAEDITEQRIKEIEAIQSQEELTAYLKKIAHELRQNRYKRLVEERPISPRREEDRIYNQMEMRKYKENKEKIKKRKEEIRRRRSEAAKSSAVPYMCTLGSLLDAASKASTSTDAAKNTAEHADLPEGALPIQDYLLSSDDDAADEQDIAEMKAECNNSPLLEKIVQGDKIVDELDALTTKRQLKRPLPPHRDLNFDANSSGGGGSSNAANASNESASNSSIDKIEYKKRRQEKKEKSKRSRDSSDPKYRKLKEKFRCEIAGIIVQHLKPYRKDTCTFGRIRSNEDFNHLARKLTHFVMVKELKYCDAVGQTLVVTDSVKNKSREFIKKYMAKYEAGYVRPVNDPEFKDIPFTL